MVLWYSRGEGLEKQKKYADYRELVSCNNNLLFLYKPEKDEIFKAGISLTLYHYFKNEAKGIF